MISVRASAPGRCGIIGNPSDMYGGMVVSCSIPNRNHCVLNIGKSGELPQDPRLLNAVLSRYSLPEPFEVILTSEVPMSSGLAGSTAMLASILLCVLEARFQLGLGDQPPILRADSETSVREKSDFAELVRGIERVEADVVCGFQDAYMITFGGMQAMDFSGKNPIQPGPQAKLESLKTDLPFLLITTGVTRSSGSVHGPLSTRWLKDEQLVIKGIARISELGRLGEESLKNQNWKELAISMKENQTVIREIGGSGDEVNQVVLDAENAGARACKLAGAGHGGTVIALTDDIEKLKSQLQGNADLKFMSPSLERGVTLD